MKSESGMSLIETLVVLGVMGVGATALMSLQLSQMKSANFLEFQVKRTQLRQDIAGQFLSDPKNCGCLFSGASAFSENPSTPGVSISGVSPSQIGVFDFSAGSTCAAATVPKPLVSAAGVDSLTLSSVRLQNVMRVGSGYSGDLQIVVGTSKDVIGPKEIPMNFSVSLSTAPAGSGMVSLTGCGSSSSSSSASEDPLITAWKALCDSKGGSHLYGTNQCRLVPSRTLWGSYPEGLWVSSGNIEYPSASLNATQYCRDIFGSTSSSTSYVEAKTICGDDNGDLYQAGGWRTVEGPDTNVNDHPTCNFSLASVTCLLP